MDNGIRGIRRRAHKAGRKKRRRERKKRREEKKRMRHVRRGLVEDADELDLELESETAEDVMENENSDVSPATEKKDVD